MQYIYICTIEKTAKFMYLCYNIYGYIYIYIYIYLYIIYMCI